MNAPYPEARRRVHPISKLLTGAAIIPSVGWKDDKTRDYMACVLSTYIERTSQ